MKITFPHIGDAHTIAKLFFGSIGIEIITPPANCHNTLEQGVKISPEEICLPFKIMIGNLMEAYHMGADTVVMPATIGPCRLGEYGELFKSVLEKEGFHYNWIILDSTRDIGKKELLKRLNLMIGSRDVGRLQLFAAMLKTYRLLVALENLEKKAHILAGYEANPGSCGGILRSCRALLQEEESLEHANLIVKHFMNKLKNVKLDKHKKPIKLLLTGEIYSLIEPFSNHRIEDLLMQQGVSFEKKITLGWWIRSNLINPFYLKWHHYKKNTYMPYGIGGYSKETVEEGLKCLKKSYDGVIQIFPVGCMPEIVAKSVLGYMSEQEAIKVLTIIFDEMSGEAGYITRIEAFIDLMTFTKNHEKKQEVANVLLGH